MRKVDALAGKQGLHQQQRQKHRHRVVKPALDLQRRVHPLRQMQPAGPHDGSDGGSVGGRHHGTQQQTCPPVDPGENGCRSPHDPRGNAGAHRGECKRGPTSNPNHRRRRLQPALEQDDHQGDAAEQVGHVEIAEYDSARAVLAGQHSQREEHQQQRGLRPGAQQAGDNGRQHQGANDQDRLVGS